MKSIKVFMALFILLSGVNSYSEEVSYRELLKLNTTHIINITVGMSESEVKTIMGDYTSAVKNGALNNPWKIESSGNASVYHYLTKKNPPFTPILEHQATPILIKNGKVVGIGRGFLKAFRENSMVSSNPVSAEKSIEERMHTLRNLYATGAIDKETFEKQKQKILDDI